MDTSLSETHIIAADSLLVMDLNTQETLYIQYVYLTTMSVKDKRTHTCANTIPGYKATMSDFLQMSICHFFPHEQPSHKGVLQQSDPYFEAYCRQTDR